MHRPFQRSSRTLLGIGLALIGHALTSHAVEMIDDPKGFLDFTWGVSLEGHPALEQTYAANSIREYRFKEGTPRLDTIPVSNLKLSSVEGKFARVVVRYQGESVHKQVMAYLEQRYGPLEKIPGQMVRGLSQQYNWRGPDTEINLTYQGQSERGFVFFDSRVFAPRFNDGITDSSE